MEKPIVIGELPEIIEMKRLLQLKQLQIDSLLDITQAINSNYSVEDLLRIYKFILRAIMGVNHLIVFYDSHPWLCVCQEGVSKELISKIKVEKELLAYKETVAVDKEKHPNLAVFDLIIPVYHKSKPLAYALIGGMNASTSENDSEKERIKFIRTMTNITTVAIENKRLFKRQLEQERMNKELELAANVQTHLIPTTATLPSNDRLEMDAIYRPHRNIGGDYYDYIPLNEDEFLVCMADISGKGVAAALLMSNVQAVLRTLVRVVTDTSDLKELIIRLNSRLREIMDERFITLFLGHHNLKTRKFTYVNAGHNPPLLLHNKQYTLLDKGCTILGFFEKLPAIKVSQLELEANSIVFTYTDGLTDVVSETGDYYEIERLQAFAQAHAHLPVKEFNEQLMEELEQFKGKELYTDDISMLTYRLF